MFWLRDTKIIFSYPLLSGGLTKEVLHRNGQQKLLVGLNMFNDTTLTLSFDVDQDTHGKVIKHKKTQHTRELTGEHKAAGN